MATTKRPGDGGRIRGRVIAAAALLVPANAFWIISSEVVYYRGHPTTASLFYNVVFWLCLLLAVNAGLGRISPRLAFRRDELLALYVLLGVTSGLGGHDTAEVLLPTIAHAGYFKNAANGWGDTVLPLVPAWLTVKDEAALRGFYVGHSNLYTVANLRPWAAPLLLWTTFLATVTGVFLCINVLFRRQWTERERLAFPLVQIPLELTAGMGFQAPGQTPLLRNGLFWAGAGVAGGLQLWNGIAALSPQVPGLAIKYTDYSGMFTSRPWNAVGWLPVGFYPFAVGLGALLPLDLSFSCWFFYLFWKAQNVVSATFGWDAIPNFPYTTAQTLGAFLAIAATTIWSARRHLAVVARNFLAPAVPAGDEDEPISYRAAVWGILGGISLLFVFCFAAGLSPLLIGAFLAIYFALAIAISRMRAELGPPTHDIHETGPDSILPALIGPSNIPDKSLAVFSLFHGFNRAYRGHPAPVQIEGFKMAERIGASYRPTFFFSLAGGVVGPLCAFWAILHLCYQKGAAGTLGPPNVLTIFGGEAWGRFDSWTKTPQPPQTGMGWAVVIGAVFVFALYAVRAYLTTFPFHPVGYAVASSWGMGVVWFPLLMAWILKLALLRLGGLPLYRRSLPFFYGLIIGDCVAGSLWSILGCLTDIPTYGFWP